MTVGNATVTKQDGTPSVRAVGTPPLAVLQFLAPGTIRPSLLVLASLEPSEGPFGASGAATNGWLHRRLRRPAEEFRENRSFFLVLLLLHPLSTVLRARAPAPLLREPLPNGA